MIKIFSVIEQSTECKALLGENPTRFFHFGEAKQNEREPFATWQLITGEPYLILGDNPGADMFTIQVDTYAETMKKAEEVGVAIRDALENDPRFIVTNYNFFGRETDTNLYRVSFDATYTNQRRK